METRTTTQPALAKMLTSIPTWYQNGSGATTNSFRPQTSDLRLQTAFGLANYGAGN